MRKEIRVALFAGVVLLALISNVIAQTPNGSRVAARDELSEGAAAFRAQQYETAIEHFRKAVSLAPELVIGHLYLATAYAQMYIPGVETEENKAWAKQAIKEFNSVLDLDPKNVTSIKGLAYLYMNMREFETAKDYYTRAIQADSGDLESYYSVGVLDWTLAYKFRMEKRAKVGLPPMSPAIQKSICPMIRAQNWELVKNGIEMFVKALLLRPDYDDAMAYLNLMYRERADIQCGDRAAYDADVEVADAWVDKTMAVKKAKAEKEGATATPDATQLPR